MHLNGTAAGLWLVGVGALFSVVPRIIRAPRPELGLAWECLACRVERLPDAVETVGLLLLAGGSAVLAGVELGPWWFALGVVLLAVVGVWAVAATKLRQLWRMRANSSPDYGAQSGLPSESSQRTVALANARWWPCFRNAFAATPAWPPERNSGPDAMAAATSKLEPRHIGELHDRDSRLEAAAIPGAVAHDVEGLQAQGFRINVVGDFVVATAPDGRTAQVSRSRVSPNSTVAVLTRHKWLNELRDLGADIRPGLRGQLHVAGGMEWRLPDQPER